MYLKLKTRTFSRIVEPINFENYLVFGVRMADEFWVALVSLLPFAGTEKGYSMLSFLVRQISPLSTFTNITTTTMDPPKKISLAFGARKPDTGREAKPANGTKRPRATLHDSDDEDEVEGKHEEVTHFDMSTGRAVNSKNIATPKQPLVIPMPPKKRQKSGLPNQNTDAAQAKILETQEQVTPITYGLNVTKKPTQEADIEMNEDVKESVAEPVKEKTIEERALDALLGKKTDSGTIIPILSEEEVFYRDYDQAPNVPSEADYDAVPIEEFGAAMLRGMGWKDGEAIGKKRGQQPVKQRVIERRPDLLGVGAKPAQALGIELGEWGKAAKKHDKKMAKTYMPVMLKNKKTGEMLTEDELKQKLQEQEEQKVLVEEDKRKTEKRLEYRSSKSSRRDDYDEGSRKDKDRRRDRDRDREYDDRKYSSSRRERESSVDSKRKRKDHDSDYNRRERKKRSPSVDRRKTKDDDYDRRERDRRRDRTPSEDRYKSRKHEEKHRDRDRKHRDDNRSSQKERSDKDRRRDRDR
jgi:hypothetical protein